MIKHKTYEIKSCDDIELNIKRNSLLEFKLSYDDEKEMKALFVFIPGCGMDACNDSYADHIAEFVVKEFEVCCLRVNYHCIQNRMPIGAKPYMDEIDKLIFNETCKSLGIRGFDFKDGDLSAQDLKDSFFYFDEMIKDMRLGKKLVLTLSLRPTKNEYQNFGVMQGLDIINAIYFVRKNYAKFKLKNPPKTLLFGSSHGGYLALLCAKFAPWLIDCVVESSAYTKTCVAYVGFIKEIDYENIGDITINMKHFKIHAFTKSLWTTNKESRFYFSPSCAQIRALSKEHLRLLASYKKPHFISYHSIKDEFIAPAYLKEEFHQHLQEFGFESKLHMISQKDVDGKFIKNLEAHGMNMSLKTLIQKELPPLLKTQFTHNKKEKKEIIYPCENLEYHFKERARGGD